jgi:hypothetical protein
MDDLIKAVRAHAVKNYSKGWDLIVEATTDPELAEMIGKAKTVTGAIRKVGYVVRVNAAREAEVKATAW